MLPEQRVGRDDIRPHTMFDDRRGDEEHTENWGKWSLPFVTLHLGGAGIIHFTVWRVLLPQIDLTR